MITLPSTVQILVIDVSGLLTMRRTSFQPTANDRTVLSTVARH